MTISTSFATYIRCKYGMSQNEPNIQLDSAIDYIKCIVDEFCSKTNINSRCFIVHTDKQTKIPMYKPEYATAGTCDNPVKCAVIQIYLPASANYNIKQIEDWLKENEFIKTTLLGYDGYTIKGF